LTESDRGFYRYFNPPMDWAFNLSDEPHMDATSGVGQLDLSNQISVAVARKAMDSQKQEGQAVIQLLESATKVQSGEAHGSSKAGGVDVYG
jgi:hypothetical protein